MKKSILLLAFLSCFTVSTFAQIIFEDHTIVEDLGNVESTSTADLDGDGDLDVITVFSKKIVWLENSNGLGRFEKEHTITTNVDFAISVYIADLDGDGDLDVLSASAYDDKIAWYENENGLGTFGAQQIISTYVDYPQSIFAADLDGDGDMDVLSASRGDDKIAWYENENGLGTFGTQQIISNEVEGAKLVRAGDLDGDGDMDIIYGSGTSIGQFKNEDGLGTFVNQETIVSWESFESLYLADLDGDNDLDLLYTSYDPTGKNPEHRITWYENEDGSGTFNFKQLLNQTSGYLRAYFADLDNDGDLDVLSTSLGDYNIVWYENVDGLGDFNFEALIIPEANGIIYAADLDGDGAMDVLSTNGDASFVTWYKNENGPGNFGEQASINEPFYLDEPNSTYAADLDGDGDMDVLSASANDNKIGWFENKDGLGTFHSIKNITTNAIGASAVFATDLDGDGDMDVLSASTNDDKIAWYKNTDGLGTFDEEQIITTNADGASAVYSADLDGDGDLDVLAASEFDDKITWYENEDGLGTFGNQQIITTNAEGVTDVYVADLDGDGDLDVLSASEIDDKIAWYENEDGLGTFGTQQIITTNTDGATSVYTADLDNDGDMDVLSASLFDNKIAWFENEDGLGTFGNEQLIAITADRVSSVYATDLDGDGDMDVLSASVTDDKIAWYINEDGLGNFGEQQIISLNANGANFVFAEDLDNDGDLDVLSVSGNDNKIAWYKNIGMDMEAPVAICQNITIELDENGFANIAGIDLDNGSTDDIGIEYYGANPSQLSCANIGENNITFTVVDFVGNIVPCSSTVTLIDNLPPVVNTKTVALHLPGNPSVSVSADQINDGSTDNCMIGGMSLDQTTFTALGEYEVVLTVADIYNNTSTGTAIVSVIDDVTPPEAICTSKSVILDSDDMASIVAIDLNNGSTDNYGVESFAVNQEIFTCDDIGTNEVILTVTDIGGNIDSCIAIVSVKETELPVVLYQPLLLNLAGANEITITVDDVDLGSYDNCGVAEKSLSQTTFTDPGNYVIVLTVTDFSDNSETRNVNVQVIDDLEPPIANCQDMTVVLNENGFVALNATAFDNGSTDDFNIASFEINQSEFYCTNLGVNDITLTVSDELGNLDSCSANLTILDIKDPIVSTQNIVVALDGQSSITISPDQIDLGSSDNCGIITMSLDQDTFTEIGEYEVGLTAEDASGNSKSETAIVTVVNSLVNVEDLSAFNKNLIIHPIPTTDKITIKAPNNISQINIYNTQGQLLITENTNSVSVSNINLTNLAAGLYLCEVKDDKGNIAIKKVIKK